MNTEWNIKVYLCINIFGRLFVNYDIFKIFKQTISYNRFEKHYATPQVCRDCKY